MNIELEGLYRHLRCRSSLLTRHACVPCPFRVKDHLHLSQSWTSSENYPSFFQLVVFMKKHPITKLTIRTSLFQQVLDVSPSISEYSCQENHRPCPQEFHGIRNNCGGECVFAEHSREQSLRELGCVFCSLLDMGGGKWE